MNETYKQGDLQRLNRVLEIYAAKEAALKAARKAAAMQIVEQRELQEAIAALEEAERGN
jgi:hypothetical protein